jgi:hypothetical protein
MRMLVEKKVDYTRSKNLILTAVTMITGLSGRDYRPRSGTAERDGSGYGRRYGSQSGFHRL